MIGYVSKWEKAQRLAKSEWGNLTNEKGLLNVTRQYFAKMIVGWNTTIGKKDGKFSLDKAVILRRPKLP